MRGLRSLLLAAALVAVPALVFAAEFAPAPQRYGTAVRVTKPVSIARLAKDPAKFKGRTIRLEGTVKDVCQGRGCWVEVVDAHGASFLAKSLDESVLLPKDCKGQHVVVEGVVTALPAAAAAEAEPADHACPKPNYVVSTRGVELRPAPATPSK
jgi:hypothetical protein